MKKVKFEFLNLLSFVPQHIENLEEERRKIIKILLMKFNYDSIHTKIFNIEKNNNNTQKIVSSSHKAKKNE